MMLFSSAEKCSYRATDHAQTIDRKLGCKESVCQFIRDFDIMQAMS